MKNDGMYGIRMQKRNAMTGDPMASGGMSGDSDMDSLADYSMPHPEASTDLHRRTLADGERGAGKPVRHTRGKFRAQANPDHGRHDGAHGVDFGAMKAPR